MSDSRTPEEFFLKKKPVRLLVELGKPEQNNYASALASDADVTYSHTVKCLQKMNEFGLVKFERRGRRKQIMLTEEGDELADDFFQILKNLTDES